MSYREEQLNYDVDAYFDSMEKALIERRARVKEIVAKQREILPKLETIAEGYRLRCEAWKPERTLVLELGAEPAGEEERAEFKRRLMAARKLLGKLKLSGESADQDVDNHKVFRLQSEDYPEVYVEYSKPIPEGSRCRVEVSEYKTRYLVCER